MYVADVNTLLSLALRAGRRARLAVWALGVRVRLARHGMTLQLEAPHGVVLAGFPTLEIESHEARGGSFRLVIGPRVRLGHGVDFQLRAGTDNVLIIGEGSRVSGGARFKLAGGLIDLGPSCRVRDFVILKVAGELAAGARVVISYGCTIHCDERVEIGDGVGLAERVTILDSEHLVEGEARSAGEVEITTEPVVIERNTAIFANAIVLKGTRLGAGCMVAAAAIVRGTHPASTLLIGSPARPFPFDMRAK